MSIFVKNSQLTKDTIDAINALIESDINATAAFKLTRLIKEFSSIVDDKITAEKKLLEKWSDKDEDGNMLPVHDEEGNVVEGSVRISNVSEFNKEFEELMEVENHLNYDKIEFEELGLKTAKIKDLIKLEFLFNV
ncbi:hypothetical protein UFOVP699_12 [uncultured Caudovirales phage]|uniref:Uncharacterized protein n=1 Tax=uncultured Caudovirales phage TaxID=2100421 RepID=A0A6J5NL86_9CAUD|nr:hypothetical protein UFOVP699_12 [uncultured Caudovirales phage]